MDKPFQPLDGFESKELKTSAYAMAIATIFLKDETNFQSSMIDARGQLEERLELLKDIQDESLRERQEESEIMFDQVREMINISKANINQYQNLIRYYGHQLGGMPLSAAKAIAGDIGTVERAAVILEAHANELWKSATELNAENTAKLAKAPMTASVKTSSVSNALD